MEIRFVFSPQSLAEQKELIRYTKKRLKECIKTYRKQHIFEHHMSVLVNFKTDKQKTNDITVFPKERYTATVTFSDTKNQWKATETTANIFAALDIVIEQIKYQLNLR